MFAYCLNNPVNKYDPQGASPAAVIIGATLISGTVSAVTTLVTGGSWKDAGLAFIGGCAEGFLICICPESTILFAGYHFLETMTECGNSGMHPVWSYSFAFLSGLSTFGLPGTGDDYLDLLISSTFGFSEVLIIDGTITASQELSKLNRTEETEISAPYTNVFGTTQMLGSGSRIAGAAKNQTALLK